MDPMSRDEHLSRMTTIWSVVQRAHAGPTDEAAQAQWQVIQRYGGAAYRYLLGAVRDPDAADELFQEFALRFVRGDFRRVDPQRGRFRDFLKTVLYHLVVDHHKKRRRDWAVPLRGDGTDPVAVGPEIAQLDRQFTEHWRDDLLARAWDALEALQRQTGQPFYTVLRFRADHPELKSPEMAKRLGAAWGKSITPEAVRQTLHRARERFAEFLLAEVSETLGGHPSHDDLECELIDLDLLDYCRSTLQKRGNPG